MKVGVCEGSCTVRLLEKSLYDNAFSVVWVGQSISEGRVQTNGLEMLLEERSCRIVR